MLQESRLAGSGGGVEESLRFHRLVKIAGDHAGLDGDHQVFFVNLQDAVHLLQGEDDPATDRHCAAAQTHPRSARGDRYPLLLGQFEYLADLLGRGDPDHHFGGGPESHHLVVGVGFHDTGIYQHVVCAYDLAQSLHNLRVNFFVHAALLI